MFNRSVWKRTIRDMSPAVLFWELRYRASGWRYPNGSRAHKEVLNLLKHAIRRHKEQDRREEQK